MSDKVEGAKITIFNDGPVEVYGPFTVVDEDGKVVAVVEEGEPVYFCRCGASKDKPFCDGTHDDIGFKGPLKARSPKQA